MSQVLVLAIILRLDSSDLIRHVFQYDILAD
jgi:hypothetical protein